MRVFMTLIRFTASIVKFIIIFFSSISSKSVEIRIMRKHFEYKIIQKILNDYKDLIISNLRDLSFNSLIKIFAIFILFINYINKFNIFKFKIYE